MKQMARNFFRGFLAVCVCQSVATSNLSAIQIEIDYSLDTNGFFDQPGSRDAMRAVCDYFEALLTDNLARIDTAEWTGETWQRRFFHPTTGADTFLPGIVVPEDTIILYVGGRNLGASLGVGGPAGYSAAGSGGDAQAWFNLLQSRGQMGALLSPPTDIGLWGGSISFNNTVSWNFSLTTPSSAAGFVSTALHEMGHVLGIGISNTSWSTYVTAGGFTGPASVASFGGNVPLQAGGGHWQDDGVCIAGTGFNPTNPLNILSRTVGQFGVPAGLDQIARMDPSGCQVGPFHLVMTDLDLAGLEDIGWQLAGSDPDVIVPPALAAIRDSGNGQVQLSWFADPSLTYQVEEAEGLAGWQNLGDPVSGETGMFVFTDTDPPTGRNFYRLEITRTEPAMALATRISVGGAVAVEVAPAIATGCKGCSMPH